MVASECLCYFANTPGSGGSDGACRKVSSTIQRWILRRGSLRLTILIFRHTLRDQRGDPGRAAPADRFGTQVYGRRERFR